MRSKPPHLAQLAPLLALSIAVGGCSNIPARIGPPIADLTFERKPIMPVEAITDDRAAADYSSSVESWGDRGWAAVARLCRWAERNKLPHPDCPRAE